MGGDSSVYGVGGGALLAGDYRLPFLPLLFVGGDLGYSLVPLTTVTSLSLPQVALDAGICLDLAPTLSARAHGWLGYAYGVLNNGGGTGGTPYVATGADIGWRFVPTLSLDLGLAYRYYFDLYNDIAVTLGMSYHVPRSVAQAAQPVREQNQPQPKPTPLKNPPEMKGKGLVIKELSLGNIFPILHAYYDTNPVGHLVLVNTEDTPMTDVTVSFLVHQFMDDPKQSPTVAELKPHQEQSIDIYALFKNTLFEVKQSTKVPAEIAVSYSYEGKAETLSRVETVRVLDRNALTWDDTGKAAAFVMPKEPAVLMFSNQINSFVSPVMNKTVDENLQTAMAFHDTLKLYGIRYVSPPLTSYANVSQDKAAIDSVKFPLETIEYRSGDCSDLSILYCSLLESVQIETAFITIPGHIFMAFAMKGSEENVRKAFPQTDQFIFRGGRAWVPIEVTERDGTFLAAWTLGAREWRENLSNKQADFYPVREAWNKFEPVNFPGIGSQPPMPDQAQVVKDFRADLDAFVSREISDQETHLLAAVQKSGSSPQSLNSLGVLYARYGLADKAEAQFTGALKGGEYLPALLNLGNLRFLKKDFEGALLFYGRAEKLEPHIPSVLLALARANHELQNYGTAAKAYDELKTVSPELADQFAYLKLQGEEATRAAEAKAVTDVVIWEEGK
jgi:tetratricopeptide (TPR) repeat protein